MNKTRVIHVTESLGGGVATAIQCYVRATPEYEHYLVGRIRSGEFSPERLTGLDGYQIVPSLREMKRAAHRLAAQPRTIVHSHSTIAGVVMRTGKVRGVYKSAYTPHCFAFERRDLSTLTRRLVWAAERRLSARTDVLVACSPREAALGAALGYSKIVMAPNVPANTERATRPSSASVTREYLVVTVGRIARQKDPTFFSRIAELTANKTNVRFLWIGDGDPRARLALERHGVGVTGWLNQAEMDKVFQNAHLYLHTAAWEGFPLSVLESAAAGIPVLVRDIPAFAELPLELRSNSVKDMSVKLATLLDSPVERTRNLELWHTRLAIHTTSAQAAALRDAYATALSE